MLGLAGNLRAIHEGKRFIRSDMNRLLAPDHIGDILNTPTYKLQDEDLEIQELISTILKEIAEYKPERIVVLDIHSTSATGGIFVISSDDPESIRIGAELHAPVILDFAREVSGTTLEYFSKKNFLEDIVAIVFECGQHREPLSVNRAIAAIINCMRTIGCINAEDVENKYDLLLQEYSKGLPRVARLIERFAIHEGRSFTMTRDFKNFEHVFAGEILAFSDNEPVAAQHEGLILLPRLQEQGDDGYFVVQPLDY
jgi:succinylglutamate desuccinylase